MRNARLLHFAALGAALALGFAPAGARPGTRSTIADLQPDYDGFFVTTDGSDASGPLDFDVLSKDGKEFTGTYTVIDVLEGVGSTGNSIIDIEGSVSTKGKIVAKGTIPGKDPNPDLKFGFKGTLSDEGELIVANYNVKNGRQTVSKGICYLEED